MGWSIGWSAENREWEKRDPTLAGCRVSVEFHRGSVLRSLLFTMYVSDLDYGINGFVAKFANDTKIGGEGG